MFSNGRRSEPYTGPSRAPGLPPYPYAMIEEFCDVPYWKQLGTETPRIV